MQQNGGISNYNALITRVITKNVGRTGLTMDASYSWSHAIDNLSDTFSSSGNAGSFLLGFQNPFQPNLDRGNAEFDIRHRVAVSAIWAVPVFRGTCRAIRSWAVGGELAPIFTANTGAAVLDLRLHQLVQLLRTGWKRRDRYRPGARRLYRLPAFRIITSSTRSRTT